MNDVRGVVDPPPRYYIVVPDARTTRCWAASLVATASFLVSASESPDARQAAVDPEQRRTAILRSWRENAKVKPAAPLLPAETAWSRTLASPPTAAGAMDASRVYVPLGDETVVALVRETGAAAWTRLLRASTAPTVGGGLVYVAAGNTIRALDPVDGSDRWSTELAGPVTASPLWDNGWLVVVTEPGTVVALRAEDGMLLWRRAIGGTSTHQPASGGDGTIYLSLSDGRLVAIALETGDLRWDRRLGNGLTAPAAAPDRVFVGTTDNVLYAFDGRGTLEWQWRHGGDVSGVAVDGDLVYVASLDNVIRAVNRGNGNQRWKQPTATRPTYAPSSYGGTVVLPGSRPSVTTFIGATGVVQGTHDARGELIGPPLVDASPAPFRVALVTITREGFVEGLRPTGMTFRDAASTPLAALPGRPITRERLP